MIKQVVIKLNGENDITLRVFKRLNNTRYLEIYIWDEYDGRGGSALIGDVEGIDNLINELIEMRKEML